MVKTTSPMFYFGSSEEKNNLFMLIYNWFLSQHFIFVVASFFYLVLMSTNVLTLIFPLSLFLYGLLDLPFCANLYLWVMSYYSVGLVFILFLYQIPVFCGNSQIFVNIFSENYQYCNDQPPDNLFKRWDFVLGITKFTGPGSYPKD